MEESITFFFKVLLAKNLWKMNEHDLHGPFSSLILPTKDGDFPVRYVSLPEGR